MATATISAPRVAELLAAAPTSRPVYRSLAEGLRLLVADGRISRGTRLPSERDLALTLRVSRTTVTHAYGALRDAGYLTSRQGAGSMATLPSGVRQRWTSTALVPVEESGDVIDLTCAATRATAGMAEAYQRAVDRLPAYLGGFGYLTLGLPELREVIAARYCSRGVPTHPEEVMVTSGAVAAVGVAARALLATGDRALVETPTYPNTTEALRRMGARLVPVPVEPTGWDVDLLASAAGTRRSTLAVLVPDFQNPTGSLMTDADRGRVATALRRAQVTPIIDETIAEICLDPGLARPLPFAAYHPGTVTVGSASKSHWGGLRTGWIRASRDLLPRLVEVRVTADLGAPVLEQLVLLELMQVEPGLSEERRLGLVEARDTLARALRATMPDWRFQLPRGGLSLWVEMAEPVASALAVAAEQEGVLVASGPRFAVGAGQERWVRLPFVHPPHVLVEAVARLARARSRIPSSGTAVRDPRGSIRPFVA